MKKILSFLFVLGMLIPMFSLAQDRSIKRDSFSLKYPADWHIDTADTDYDPDALFSIDSPDGESFIMFIIYDIAMDQDDILEAQVKEFTAQLMKKPTITTFDSWGKYKGKGKLMKGKIAGVYKGFVKIFVYADEHKSMLVVEQGYDEDLPALEKAYGLISSTFRFTTN